MISQEMPRSDVWRWDIAWIKFLRQNLGIYCVCEKGCPSKMKISKSKHFVGGPERNALYIIRP